MASELETVVSEWWFARTIRAIVAEFVFEERPKQAKIRKLENRLDAKIEYGRYFIRYDKAENIIYVS